MSMDLDGVCQYSHAAQTALTEEYERTEAEADAFARDFQDGNRDPATLIPELTEAATALRDGTSFQTIATRLTDMAERAATGFLYLDRVEVQTVDALRMLIPLLIPAS
jgi:hypothetical protein